MYPRQKGRMKDKGMESRKTGKTGRKKEQQAGTKEEKKKTEDKNFKVFEWFLFFLKDR